MNETTLTPAPQEVVPVPVSAHPALEHALEPVVQARPIASVPFDQIPTARVQTIPPPLPPPVPPPGPAHQTQPLRPITREDAARLAETKRLPWRTVLGHFKRAAEAVPSRFGALGGDAWTERRVGLASAAIGVTLIVGALVIGWQSIAIERFERVEHASLAVALVLARAALAIATMIVGYGLLRVGERTMLASSASRRDHSDARTR